jgi:ATP-dependent DNA helicase RecQ
MKDPKAILKQFWGYDSFRPLQSEIVQSVLSGHDTLAILPTGGGKSVCFQVPAMALEGVCVVVTPLIALMQDQVHQLNKRGIEAVAVFSGLSRRAIENALDACAYGKTKFLYVSPERLKTDYFVQRSKSLPIALLAIDEAHCISQWGYDFRPPYLEIANYREVIRGAACIALTASATQKVRDDIVQRLNFKNHKTFVKSFARDNLSYSSVEETTKPQRLTSLLDRVPGTAIVYVRSRERTALVSQYLQSKNIAADFYHAGLSLEQRTQKQKDWISGKTRVIAATNAFGMGIDKPDVRLVVHLDLPESMEAYYQEAGRAGRDEKKAFAVLLYNQGDAAKLHENIVRSSPDTKFLNLFYSKMANFYKVAVGTGFMSTFEFELEELATYAQIDRLKAYHALKRLQQIGLIELDDPSSTKSKLLFRANKQELYAFEVANQGYGEILSCLLRSYEGILTQASEIDEVKISVKTSLALSKVIQSLEFLDKAGIVCYEKKIKNQVITFLTDRKETAVEGEFKKKLDFLYKRNLEQVEAMINYAQDNQNCRTKLILTYFDEKTSEKCGICDSCVKEKKQNHYKDNLNRIKLKIKEIVSKKPQTLQELKLSFSVAEQEIFEEAAKQLVESGGVFFDDRGRILAK